MTEKVFITFFDWANPPFLPENHLFSVILIIMVSIKIIKHHYGLLLPFQEL